MDCAQKPIFQISPSSWIGSGSTGSRRSCVRETRRASCLLFPTTSSGSKTLFSVKLGILAPTSAAHGPARPTLREERSSCRRLFDAASSNARRDRNLRTTCWETHPWNQPRLCVYRRWMRQYILAPLCLQQMSWPAAFELVVFFVIQNVRSNELDAASRHQRLSLPRGTDSLSLRCLDTCCFLARQLHVARKTVDYCSVNLEEKRLEYRELLGEMAIYEEDLNGAELEQYTDLTAIAWWEHDETEDAERELRTLRDGARRLVLHLLHMQNTAPPKPVRRSKRPARRKWR